MKQVPTEPLAGRLAFSWWTLTSVATSHQVKHSSSERPPLTIFLTIFSLIYPYLRHLSLSEIVFAFPYHPPAQHTHPKSQRFYLLCSSLIPRRN